MVKNPMTSQRVLIIGGLGYVGSRLIEALAPKHTIVATARRLGGERQAWLESLPHEVDLVEFDSADVEREIQGDFDLVINLAMPSASEAATEAEGKLQSAYGMMDYLLSNLSLGRFKRLIHFSTFHVYGNSGLLSYSEEDIPKPHHPYGQIHHACESYLLGSTQASSIAIVRPSNIIGYPAHLNLGPQAGLIYLDLCRQAAQSHRISLRNNGEGYRDFIEFPDLIKCIKLLVSDASISGLFNLAQGKSLTLGEMAREIQSHVGREFGEVPALSFGDGADAFVEPFVIDVSRLRSLGFSPSGCLTRELSKTLNVFRK